MDFDSMGVRLSKVIKVTAATRVANALAAVMLTYLFI